MVASLNNFDIKVVDQLPSPLKSRFCTLLPGDVILTGTPPGVGCFRKPPEYLKVHFFHCIVLAIPLYIIF